MMSVVLPYLFLVLFLHFSSASVSTGTTELCSTKYGATSPSPVPSSTRTKSTTSRVTIRSTSTPVVTVTPSPSTTRVTVTSTATVTKASTTGTITDTVYSQVSVTSTSTTVSSVFSTTVVTVTETLSTTTVPTPSGFTYPNPIPSSTSPATNQAASRPDVAAINRNANINRLQQVQLDGTQGSMVQSPAQYPTSILCTETIEVFSTTTVIRTTKPVTTTAPASTITSTSTANTTSTTSIYEVFSSTTITLTQTAVVQSVITTTTTKLTTETATLIPPASTLYAACSPQNILTPPPGFYFAGQSYYPASFQTVVGLPHNTSYDCCVACITDPYCKAAEFFAVPAFNQLSCTLDYGDSTTKCDQETVHVSIGNGGMGYQQSLSGGNCGGGFLLNYQGS